jgi:hypothetical protein
MANRHRMVIALVLLASIASLSGFGQPHYAMDVAVNFVSGSVAGTLLLNYVNTTGIEQSEVFFRLYPNATYIYGGASLRVLTATVDGVSVEPQLYVDDTALMVPLADVLAPGEATTIGLTFETKPSSRAPRTQDQLFDYGILTKSEQTLVLSSFYPLLAPYTDEGWTIDPPFPFGDALSAETASYDVRLTVPPDVTLIATGTHGEPTDAGDAVTYHCTIDRARDFTVVLATGLPEQTASAGSTRLRARFAPEHAAAAERALEVGVTAVELFGLSIAPCPFDEIDIVEVPLSQVAGVEFSGLILVSTQYAGQPSARFYDVIVSHEIAHQWFYAGVGSDPIESPWLDESLATYLSYVFLEAAARPGEAAAELATWRRAYEQARSEHPDLAVNSPLYDFPDSSTYSAFVYSGGAVLLDTIRETIGDAAFFSALADYYAGHEHGFASGMDLFSAFEDACSCSLAPVRSDFGLDR